MNLPQNALPHKTDETLKEETGSISVIVIGLFLITVSLIMVIGDVSAMVFARKALSQQTEYLVQQGIKSVDLDKYYQGRGGLLPYLAEKTILDQTDPGIPLNCSEVESVIADSAQKINDSTFENFTLTYLKCNGSMTYIETQARVKLPYRLPFLQIEDPIIYGYAGNAPERRNGFWIKAIRLW